MFVSERGPQLEQYVLPEYWGGHTIGSCTPANHNNDNWQHVSSNGAAEKRFLEEYVNERSPRFVLESYRRGDEFDISAQRVGAIVFAKREVLVAQGGVSIDLESLDGIPCPQYDGVLPRDGNRFYYTSRLRLANEDESLTYVRCYTWGAITKTRKGNAVSFCPETHYDVDRKKKIVAPNDFLDFPSTGIVEIGKAQHIVRSKPSRPETISRVMALDVCTYGKAQEEERTLFAFFGRFATNSSTAER